MHNTWKFISDSLQKGIPTVLLYVVSSSGSSPGRKGFMMAVNAEGVFCGTIGGGIMEVKMIELAKSKLSKKDFSPVLRTQFHDKQHAKDQSGMICSGEQQIVLMPLEKTNLSAINKIIKREFELYLSLSEDGFKVSTDPADEIIQARSNEDFNCVIKLDVLKRIHIFGGGHVGVALSKQMSILGYQVLQYDDRPDVYTLNQNEFATEKKIIEFNLITNEIKFQASDIIAIVSFSYRSDKIILKNLYKFPFAFIGMMGSDAKIATLRKELKTEGISQSDLAHVHMPIGVKIYSKKAEEIAVSIAGQIIFELNKTLPTGRRY